MNNKTHEPEIRKQRRMSKPEHQKGRIGGERRREFNFSPKRPYIPMIPTRYAVLSIFRAGKPAVFRAGIPVLVCPEILQSAGVSAICGAEQQFFRLSVGRNRRSRRDCDGWGDRTGYE